MGTAPPPDSRKRDFYNTVKLYSEKNKPSALLRHPPTLNISGTIGSFRTVYVISIEETRGKTGCSSGSLPNGPR